MKSIRSNPLIIPVAEVFAKAISFVNILLLIRIFSIYEYADYSYLVSVILWASVLMDSGINDLIYNKSLKKDANDLDSLFTGKVFLSIIVVLLLGIFFAIEKTNLLLPGIMLSMVILFSSLTAFIKMYARGNNFIDNDLVTILSEPILRLIFLIIVVLTNSVFLWSFSQVFLFYLMAGIFAFIISYLRISGIYRFHLLLNHIKEPLNKIRNILKDTRYYLLYYLMLMGLQRLDIIMIEKYGIKEDLAVFSTAITIYQVIYLFFYALITTKIMILLKNKKYLYNLLLPVLIFIVLITFIISPFIYMILFPEAYYSGYKVLNYLMISIIPSVFSLYFIIKNNYKGMMKKNFYILAFVLFLKFSAYLILKSDHLPVYYIVYGIMELLLVFLFIFYPNQNENITDQ